MTTYHSRRRVDLAVMRYIRFRTMRPSGAGFADQVTHQLRVGLQRYIGEHDAEPYFLTIRLRRLKNEGLVYYESTRNRLLLLRLTSRGRQVLQDDERHDLLDAATSRGRHS